MAKIAVIQFPGMNCEAETVRALLFVGLEAEIVRWNVSSCDSRRETGWSLSSFDGFVLPGGFSYQDRVRAGVIASRHPLMSEIKSAAADGKPVLGICNGAQILVEAGLVPGLKNHEVGLGLAPNSSDGRSGYYCSWVHLKSGGSALSAFTSTIGKDEVLPLPVGHAEGRFSTSPGETGDELDASGQISLKYSTPSGDFEPSFPANPNGSFLNAAGVCNAEGNVLALIPHPERAIKLRHVPENLAGTWGEMRRRARGNIEALEGPGPGEKIFSSMKEYLSHR